MTNSYQNYNSEINLDSASKSLKPLLIEYLSTTVKLEELSKVSPTENDNTTFNQSVSGLMQKQEDLLQRFCDFEIQDSQDARRILNVWANEEVIPDQVSVEQQLVLNIYDFLNQLNES